MTAPKSRFPNVTGVAMIRTVCGYCGVGCGLVLEVENGPDGRRAVRARGDRDQPANAGRLCTKGTTSAEMLTAPGRMRTGLRRGERGAAPVEVDVDEAITEVARKL